MVNNNKNNDVKVEYVSEVNRAMFLLDNNRMLDRDAMIAKLNMVKSSGAFDKPWKIALSIIIGLFLLIGVIMFANKLHNMDGAKRESIAYMWITICIVIIGVYLVV